MAVKTSWSSGDVLTAADLTDTFAAKADAADLAVMQVASTTKQTSFTTSSTSMVDITDLTVTITPSSSSNLILVSFTCIAGNSTNDFVRFQLVRDSTAIGLGSGGTANVTTAVFTGDAGMPYAAIPVTATYLDSPATTSATTYKVQMSVVGGTGCVGRRSYDTAVAAISTITVMEVAP